MINKSKILSVALAISAMVASCNSDEYEEAIPTSESVVVTAFSLSADSKVLSNLDSVFFSIDLQSARIFNADSLPYGTKVDKLVPVIGTQGVSVAELSFRRAGKADTVVNYISNPGDSIDFSQGPVSLRLVSASGTVERNYSISVNVHAVRSDEMVWGGKAVSTLPGGHPGATGSATVEYASKFYTLLLDGGKYFMAVQDTPLQAVSQSTEVSFGGDIDLQSFIASASACYVVDDSGRLLTASDPAGSWSDTGLSWHSTVATYGSDVIGSKQAADGSWSLEYFPSGKSEKLPDGFPVKGCSQTVSYRFEMSTATNVLIVGGRQADGNLTPDCWSYDGRNWVKLSRQNVMLPVEGLTVFPYFTVRTAADWVPTRYSTLVAFGGRNALGTLNRKLYISYDFGIQWIEAGDLMQLPDYVPSTCYARAFVVDRTLSTVAPKITKPITDWECPFIYLYGGNLADGSLSDTIWQAVIYRFMFKPVE